MCDLPRCSYLDCVEPPVISFRYRPVNSPGIDGLARIEGFACVDHAEHVLIEAYASWAGLHRLVPDDEIRDDVLDRRAVLEEMRED